MEKENREHPRRKKLSLRWDRILAVVGLVLSPFILRWFADNINFGSFNSLPIIRSCSNVWEVKSLVLLCLVMLGIVLAVKLIRAK